VLNDVRIRASLINSYSIARAFIFECTGSLEDLRVAMAGFRRACDILSPQDCLLEWSRSRGNYGAALARLGSTTNDGDTLVQAIEVMKEALPGLSLALAGALMLSGNQCENISELRESISIFEDLLKVNDPALQREAKNNLGGAYYCLGVASDDVQYLEISRDVLSDLIQNADTATFPFVRAQSHQSYGRALREIGRVRKSTSIVRTSIEIFKEGLISSSKENAPVFWAAVHMHIASGYFELARLDTTLNSLELAQDHISESLSILGPNSRGGLTTQALKLAESIHEFADDLDHEGAHRRGDDGARTA
jgi:tetratricopeptide (TPR) repeat protein